MRYEFGMQFRSDVSEIDDPVFVSGIWLSHMPKIMRENLRNEFEGVMKLITGSKAVIFCENRELLDMVRHMAFDNDIALIGVEMPMHETPGVAYLDDFSKRMKSYAISQEASQGQKNFMEKAENLYWLHYRRFGEDYLLGQMSQKLGKVELVGELVPNISTFQSQDFMWLDPDLNRQSADIPGFLQRTSDWRGANLSTQNGQYSYLGRKLPFSSATMIASKGMWAEIVPIYKAQMARLGRFPYIYDEEVVLSLAGAQHPGKIMSEKEITGRDERLRYMA